MKNINEYFLTLYKLERTRIKYDLKNIKKLLHELGNPHLDTKFIHIAGTNGKGAVASFLTSILIEHGFKTGLYTSPHLLKFNERIQVNGNFIPDSYIKSFVDNNLHLFKKIKASFFEVTTALAFKYLSDQKVDIAVIEVGLGGRLDSTNIIDPELCIITQIGIDHTQYLGKTLKSIAKEKIGIVKESKIVIISDTHKELYPFYKKYLKSNSIYFLDAHIKSKLLSERKNNIKFETHFINQRENKSAIIFNIPLNGVHNIRNASTALLTAEVYLKSIKRNFSIQKLKRALRNVKQNTYYHGRYEFIKNNGTNFIFDVAHNPDAIKSSVINSKYYKINAVVFGIMNDKDYKTSLQYLKELQSPIIFTKPSYERARDPEDLFKYYIKINPPVKNDVILEKNLRNALKQACTFNTKDGFILILGSFFLVSESIKILKFQHYLNK